jgi:hypothetical protein
MQSFSGVDTTILGGKYSGDSLRKSLQAINDGGQVAHIGARGRNVLTTADDFHQCQGCSRYQNCRCIQCSPFPNSACAALMDYISQSRSLAPFAEFDTFEWLRSHRSRSALDGASLVQGGSIRHVGRKSVPWCSFNLVC